MLTNTLTAASIDMDDGKHLRAVICRLNKDIVIGIFMCLQPGKSRFRFASACKKMFSVFKSPPCWSDTLVFPVTQLPHLRFVMQSYPVRKISFFAGHSSGMLGQMFGFDCMGAAGAKQVARAVTGSVHLQALDISCNHIGPAGARAIATAIKQCPQLSDLDLHHNNLSSAGVTTVCEALAAGCPRLHTLDVSSVGGETPNICVSLAY